MTFMNDISLSEMREGEWARIVAIDGGRMSRHGEHRLRQKLLLRGLLEGSVVRVISCRGPITIEVDRNIVAIGRGMAQKIRVVRM